MSGTLALSGVFSSIDTDSLVSGLMAIESKPLYKLQEQQSTWESKASSLTGIKSRLTDLQNLAEKLSDINKLKAVTVSSSDKSILSVSTSDGVTEGYHTIVVNRLASAEKLVHDAGLAETTTLVGEGAFSYTYNGVTRTIQTTAETTLEGLKGLINNDASNPGVTASLLRHNDTYHLVLSGDDSGSDYGITINDTETTLSGFDTADFLETQTAMDSQIRVNGYPAETWLERSSNTINDVIPGVTLNLYSTGTVNVTMSRNTSTLSTNLSNLVSIYNGIVDEMDTLTGYDETTETGGLFQGDSTLRLILSQLRTALSSAAPGFVDGQDSFTLLDQLGLSFDKYGKMELDTTTLDEALSQDYLGVLKLIGASGAGTSDSNYIQFSGTSDSTEGGTYEVKVSFDANGKINQAQIRKKGTATWHDADYSGTTITGAAGYAEEGLKLNWAWQTGLTSPQTAEIRVQQGFSGVLVDKLDGILDETDGILAIKNENISKNIEQVKSSISRMEDRLADKEERLKAKYARLEATLAQLDSQRAAIDALLTSLKTSTSNDDD